MACGIRGNIDTRLLKVYDGEFAGVIVAAAAMIRLGWEDRITEYLSVEHFTPAVGQGALGIEIRSEDEEMATLVSKINDEITWQAVTAERTYLQALGGGCRTPIAALGTVSAGILKLTGIVASADGSQILRAAEEGHTSAPEQIGKRLARKMLESGALALITAGREPSQS
jgi:hydroxymethylbilane synthase